MPLPHNPFTSSFCVSCGIGWKFNGQEQGGKSKGKGKGKGKDRELVWGDGSVEGPGHKGKSRHQHKWSDDGRDAGLDEWVLVPARQHAAWLHKKEDKGEGKGQPSQAEVGQGSRYTPLAEADDEPKIVEVKEDEGPSLPAKVVAEHKMLLGTITSLSQRLANATKSDKGVKTQGQ